MLETIKNIKKDKSKEKLIYILILLIILFIAVSLIFDDDKENNPQLNDTLNSIGNVSNVNNEKSYFIDIENRLATILNKIEGVSEVSVMMTFSNDSTLNPIYNIKEEEKDGNVTTEKEVVYNEEDNGKVLATQTIEMPKIEAVVIVGNGLDNINMKTKVIEAVSNLTNVGIHKVVVFEKGE